MEELELEGGGTISRLNFEIAKVNAAKGDDLLKEIPNVEKRFVLNQRMKEMKLFDSWIDLSVAEEVDCNSNFDTVARGYIITTLSIVKDDLSYDTFFRSTRMAEVLKNLMKEFLKTKQDAGFMYGDISSLALPERVSISGIKSLMSGVSYLVTIQ